MSFFDSFYPSDNTTRPDSWKELNDPRQIDDLIDTSNERPQLIFKDSIRCDLSAMKKSRMIDDWKFEEENFDFHYLDLINHRTISNLIETTFGVRHESPQLLVVRNGQVVFNTSHHGVTIDSIKEALTQP